MCQQGIAAKASGQRESPARLQERSSLHFQPLESGVTREGNRPDPAYARSGQ